MESVRRGVVMGITWKKITVSNVQSLVLDVWMKAIVRNVKMVSTVICATRPAMVDVRMNCVKYGQATARSGVQTSIIIILDTVLRVSQNL